MTITYSIPFKDEISTLKLKGSAGIGYYEDIDGKKWEVENFVGGSYTKSGKNMIHARMIDNCPKYSTAPWVFNRSWEVEYKPYYVEYIN